MRIHHLLEVPDVAPALAQWFIDEWPPWYGPEGPGDAEADLAACRSRNVLPICLVATADDDRLLGTVALRAESVGSEHGVGPWLAAFLVGKPHRSRGIGTALVAALENEARSLGFASIYTSTDTAASLFERRGWRRFATSKSLRGPVTVYRLALVDL